MTYSKVYRNIRLEVIAASKEMIPAIWRTDEEAVKVQMMKDWLVKVSAIYGVPVPDFLFEPENEEAYSATGGGCYNCVTNQIRLFKKASFVTLAHEFRHMMQYKAGVKMYKGDAEEDARAWSVSLFRLTDATAFRRAVRKGILHFN
jgi:hypothetical protein